MKEIELKLLELEELLKTIPLECKGVSNDAHFNRMRYMKVKSTIGDLLEIFYSYGRPK